MKTGADSTGKVTMLASCDGRSMTIRSVGNVGAALDVLMCSGHSSTSMSTKSITSTLFMMVNCCCRFAPWNSSRYSSIGIDSFTRRLSL